MGISRFCDTRTMVFIVHIYRIYGRSRHIAVAYGSSMIKR